VTDVYLAPYGTPAPARLEYERLVRQLRAARAPWHLTFDTRSTPTRQDPILTNYSVEHDYDDVNNCPRCETGRFAPDAAPAAALAPAFQYGVRADGEVRWPDEDDELYFRRRPGSETGGHIKATDLPALHAAAKLSGVALVQRALGPVEDVPVPLPTTPGSVIRATLHGYAGIGVFGLTCDQDSEPWRQVDGAGDYYEPGDLALIEVIFDAGAAA
jgi:hypothetical protein